MMESGDYINKFTRVLNHYAATLVKLNADTGTVDAVGLYDGTSVSVQSHQPAINCEIVFHDFC